MTDLVPKHNGMDVIENQFLPADTYIILNKRIYTPNIYRFCVHMKAHKYDCMEYESFASFANNKRDMDLFPIFARYEVELIRFLNKFK